jgi:hypothetical protein
MRVIGRLDPPGFGAAKTLDEHLREAAAKEYSNPIFKSHACWKCRDGEKPCVQVHPGRCGFPRARND